MQEDARVNFALPANGTNLALGLPPFPPFGLPHPLWFGFVVPAVCEQENPIARQRERERTRGKESEREREPMSTTGTTEPKPRRVSSIDLQGAQPAEHCSRIAPTHTHTHMCTGHFFLVTPFRSREESGKQGEMEKQ